MKAFLVSAFVLVAAAASASPRGQAPAPKPAALPSGYVGDDTCVACHDNKEKQLSATLHGKSKNTRTPSANVNQACETCHGPGKEHSETGDKTKIRAFASMKPRDVSEVCVGCHNRSTHAQWKGSMHDARNLSCITCHSVHNPKAERAQLKAASIT